MKIGFFADGQWALNTLKEILKSNSLFVEFVALRYSNPDDSIANFCTESGIDYFVFQNVNSDQSLKEIKTYNCDVFLSVSYDQIFGSKVLNIPNKFSINFHAGMLPFYRGRNVINWALINGEKNIGLTVHYVDSGIDTGDIILQEEIEVSLEDDYGSVLEKIYSRAPKLIIKALEKASNKDFNPIKQKTIDPYGFYFGKREVGDENINWNDTSFNIYNFIRALSKPGPIARTYIGRNIIKIHKAKFIKELRSYIGIPGQVIGINKSNLFVKTKDSFLIITKYEALQKIRVGDRLGEKS